ncbi:protein FAM90A15-like [Dasypus novemcinctus]|uniref:protein FAM90A15-like n=1 Tax=Dasypus novemcinctus TaxID=9361 RepID=UPI00265EEE59|nr:putative protein FAM90A15P [Dasypus novemcinctus]
MTWGQAEYKGLPGRETSLTLPPSPALEAALLSWDPDRPTPPRDLLLDHRITAGLLGFQTSRPDGEGPGSTKKMRRAAGLDTLPQPHRLPKATSVKELQGVALGKRAPPAEVEESRVKCKDCGAFGHTARNLRCPMKRWGQTLTLWPLGSHQKEKENLAPCTPTQLQTPGSSHRTARVEGPRHRHEEKPGIVGEQKVSGRPQRKEPQNGRDWREPGDSIRRACRPLPVHAPPRRPEVVSLPTGRPPLHLPARRSRLPAGATVRVPGRRVPLPHGQPEARKVEEPSAPQPASKGLGQPTRSGPDGASSAGSQHAAGALSPRQALQLRAHGPGTRAGSRGSPQPATQRLGQERKLVLLAPNKRAAQIPLQVCQNPPKKPRRSPFRGPRLRARGPGLGAPPTLQAADSADTPAHQEAPQGIRRACPPAASTHVQEPRAGPHGHAGQARRAPRPPAPGRVPGPPLRVVFTRLVGGSWSASFPDAPTGQAPAKPAAPRQSPRAPGEPEGLCPGAAKSVLYEDLLVSSSEESDCG